MLYILDQGLETVWAFAEKVIFPYVEDNELVGVVDFKTQFQEFVHRQNKGDVTYRLIKKKVRRIIDYLRQKLFLENKAVAEGKGKTKKESEQKAAEQAYKSMKRMRS